MFTEIWNVYWHLKRLFINKTSKFYFDEPDHALYKQSCSILAHILQIFLTNLPRIKKKERKKKKNHETACCKYS